MDFQQWLKANGYEESALSPTQRKHLESAWKAETQPVIPVATIAPPNGDNPYEVELAQARLEADRRASIDRLITEQMRAEAGFPERIERLDLIRKAATEGKWDITKTQFELLKEGRRLLGSISTISREQQATPELIEAAVLRGIGFSGLEKKFSEQTLHAMDKTFPSGMSLSELTMHAAKHNSGYRGSHRDIRGMCRAAFRGGMDFRQDAGPSTIDVSGILSNVANKVLEQSFLYTEQAWRGFSKIKSANDYKTMSIYRMTGSATYEKVAPGGEIKHGTLGELSYTLKADLFAKLLGISEQDWRNEDLGAFSDASAELGRGGGEALNNAVYTEWLDDSSFFTTGNSNYDDGTDTVLGLAGLNHVETIFRTQTKPDGTLLGAMPKVLLVPAALYNTALQLMGSQGLVVGTTPDSGPQQNVFFGRYATVSSAFLDQRATVGATSWYLLADPQNIAGMYVSFLDGIQQPMVEAGQFDFDRLGLALRGRFSFGVAKGEYRCGVRVKGAA